MTGDPHLYTEQNLLDQLSHAPYDLGTYTLRFYTEGGKPVNKVTGLVEVFYLSPSGGTLRDKDFHIIWYDSRFDTYRGFVPPHRSQEK
jgi:hypothetical protein